MNLDDFRELLEHPGRRVAFVGLGNSNLADDGAGTELARRLARVLPPPHRAWVGGLTPERCLRELREERFDLVVLLDAVEFGAAPGTVAWFDALDLASRFPTVSTHRLPLSLLARLIVEGTRTQVGLLGIQPGSLRPEPGTGPGPEVLSAIEDLVSMLRRSLVIPARVPNPALVTA